MRRQKSLDRAGITLTELLVVVSIIVLVTSALLPMLRPVLKGQKTREAARQLNVFLTGVQARAIERGRPVGVWIERAEHVEDPSLPIPPRAHTAYRFYVAEEPPPYTGDTLDARVLIQCSPNPQMPNLMLATFVPPGCGNWAVRLVQRGDLIRFSNRGPLFAVEQVEMQGGQPVGFRVDASPFLKRFPPNRLLELISWLEGKYDKKVFNFEVVRAPTKSIAAPLELPNNVGIDLMMSGYSLGLSPFDWGGTDAPTTNQQSDFQNRAASVRLFSDVFGLLDATGLPTDINADLDILIMFRPQGGVDRICWVDAHGGLGPVIAGSDLSPRGTIGLLIARDDRIGQLDQELSSVEDTLEDKSNIWLSIDTQSGRIVSTPNSGAVGWFSGVEPAGDPRTTRIFRIWNSRDLAVDGQNMGGR